MRRGTKPLSPAGYAFRHELLALLDRSTPLERFFYVDEDTCVGVCPVCGGGLAVRFAGCAARGDLDCHKGCAEQEALAALTGPLR